MVFITRSLAPAKLKEIQLDRENKKANVTVAADQVSLAIGKNGQNVRLASKLTGYDIQLIKEGGEEEEYDMDLSEFREELGDVIFHKFFDEGYETVHDVIDTPVDELVAALGIEKEKIQEIVTLLRGGLEDAEIEDAEESGAAPPAAPAEPAEAEAAAATSEPESAEPSAETIEPASAESTAETKEPAGEGQGEQEAGDTGSTEPEEKQPQ